uniref:hypothetical protein n=1 Tax=Gormaniella terricola TaxID=2904618 RepID=UPI0021CC72C6|nr:hypothetical protein [Gormaniella terricola]UWV18275.1 hypothetical protein [Gormaniella terricola]
MSTPFIKILERSVDVQVCFLRKLGELPELFRLNAFKSSKDFSSKRPNLYDFFIDILKQKASKGFSENTVLHKHHIKPLHSGGSPDGELVICTIRDHARAHYIRYLVFGETYDLCAYYGLVKKTDLLAQSIQKKIINTNRERGNIMFNNEWQKIMANRPKSSYYFQEYPAEAARFGKKGGEKGGLANTPKQQETRSKNGKRVGTLFGRKGGLKHQNPMTKEKLSHYLEWTHNSGIMTISPPFESVCELKDFLNMFVPDSMKNSSGISDLLREKEKCRYGWKITRVLDI